MDEGFLARMMRPTQASANKVAEKAPTTPPRKTQTLTRKPSSAKISVAKRAAPKTTPAANPVVQSPETTKAPAPAAKEVAPKEAAPKVEKTANAEEVTEVAKEAEGTTSLEPAEEKAASPTIPKTPEHEPIIVEEEEEPEEASVETTGKTQNPATGFSKMEDALNALGKKDDAPSASEVEVPKASEAPEEASQEPEVEKADAPLANGNHKIADTGADGSAGAEEAEIAVEQPVSETVAANGAASGTTKAQEQDDEETW